MRLLGVAFAFVPLFAFGATPGGQQIALHGNSNGALPCAACHGVNGGGNTSMGAPPLAGLPQPMIVNLLTQFSKGQGGNAVMQSIAHALTPEEMKAVAAYFSRLPKT